MTSKQVIDTIVTSAREKGFIAVLLTCFVAVFFWGFVTQSQRISHLEDRIHNILVEEVGETRRVVEKNTVFVERATRVLSRLESTLDR